MPAADGARLPRPVVPPRPLGELAALLGVPVAADRAGTGLTGVTLDSRSVAPGDLYAAVPGAHAHGAEFCAQAAAGGAVAVLTDEAGRAHAAGSGLPVLVVPDPRAVLGEVAAWVYGHPAERLLLVGITGTNGKTTTAYLVEAGLRAAGHRTGLLGTVQTRVGDEVVDSARTTPEAPDVQALMALMVERGCTAAVMEVSSHALSLGRVDGLVFDVAVFTNLSQDHLDFHGTIEEYYAAKAALFTPQRARLALVDVDDEHGRRLAVQATVPVVTCSSLHGKAGAAVDWRAQDVRTGPDGSTFTVLGPSGERAPVDVRLPGAFNVANTLCAVVALTLAGVPLPAAAAGVGALAGVPGRMEPVRAGQPYLALVDYAHTPDAVTTLLTAVRRLVPGRVVVVLGCGGDRDPYKRPLMGAAAVRGSDLAVLTSDNPRSEDPRAILRSMAEGALEVAGSQAGERVVVEPDRAAAIARAVRAARAGDAVVVAGKGHETGQEIAGVVRPFDDRVELRRAIGQTAQRWTAGEVAGAAGGRVEPADAAGTPVSVGAGVDSRTMPPGGLFVAVKGEHVDGYDFARSAVEAGAAVVLADRAVGGAPTVPTVVVDDVVAALGRVAHAWLDRLRSTGPVQVVGVTGSSGKTTTKDLLATVLAGAGPTVATPHSYNNEIGLPLTVLSAGPGTAFLVLEMGARGAGHLTELTRIAPPQLAVVLNIGSAHVGEFGSRERTAQAKGELVAALAADGVAVLNADDELVATMSSRTDARVVTFGTAAGADVRAVDLSLDAGRARFTLSATAGSAPVGLRLVGAHQVSNALAVAAVGLEAGLSVQAVAAALSAAEPSSRWRMEVTDRGDGVTVVNDAYNANPDSVRAALEALVALAGGRRTWAVLGEMLELGRSAAAEHEAVGRLVAALGVDRLVAVGPGARPVYAGATLAPAWSGAAVCVADADEALALLRAELAPGDVVLVKASRAAGLERVALGLVTEAAA